MENINNELFFSDILEQIAITVVIRHLNTLKLCVAVELRYSNQLNRYVETKTVEKEKDLGVVTDS